MHHLCQRSSNFWFGTAPKHTKIDKSASGTHSRTLRSLSNDKKVAVKRATTVCALISAGSGVQGLEHADHVSKSGRERERAHALLLKTTSCSSGRKPFVCALHRRGAGKNKVIKVCKQCLGAALTDKQAGKGLGEEQRLGCQAHLGLSRETTWKR